MTVDVARSLREAESAAATCAALALFAADGFERFGQDLRTQWAVEMGFIRIGEAVNRIDVRVTDRFPHQPWRDIIALRNFTAHQYQDLSPRRVWATLTRDVPALQTYLTDTVIPTLRQELDDQLT